MIWKPSIWDLKLSILKFNLRIPWAGSGEPFHFFIVPTDNLWMVRLLFLLENFPIRVTSSRIPLRGASRPWPIFLNCKYENSTFLASFFLHICKSIRTSRINAKKTKFTSSYKCQQWKKTTMSVFVAYIANLINLGKLIKK